MMVLKIQLGTGNLIIHSIDLHGRVNIVHPTGIEELHKSGGGGGGGGGGQVASLPSRSNWTKNAQKGISSLQQQFQGHGSEN
ncbi:unnamed protein product [Musa acuminata var. zebrina]